MDNRSQLEANELSDLVGAARVLEVSGQPEICAIWPLTKFRWLRKNESEHFQRTAKFLLPEDYILYRLCGEIVAEQTAWSSSLVLDIRRKTWSTEMLEFAALSAAQMPQLCAPGTLIGTISEACSAETGLCQSTKVVAGALDQVCAAIGAGNIAPGITTESTGSVLALLATVSEPIFDATSRVPCHIHAVPNTYCLLPWNPTGGLVLKWFKDNFVASDDGDNGAFSKSNLYDLMLPHLGGALFPEYDHTARGVFFGATLSHRRPHFVRAIMEAIAFMIRRDLEGLNRLGAETREIRVLGGGAKSRVWSQIKADVSQVSVVLPAQTEAAALGAAILAAVGAGIYSDIPAAVRNMTRMSEVIRPHTAPKEIYDASYSLYVDLYKHVKELFSQCDRIKELASKQNLLAREAL